MPQNPHAAFMISLDCPGCGQKLKVPGGLAGKKVRCPQCKQSLGVPSFSAATQPAMGRSDQIAAASATLSQTFVPATARTVRSLKAEANYSVDGEIARGGMGSIMRAIDDDIRREVAVKFLLNEADP